MNKKIWMLLGAGIGVGVVGAAIYAHKRHGGTMTFGSFKNSLSDLLRVGKSKAADVKVQLEDLTHKVGGIEKMMSGAEEKAKDTSAPPSPTDGASEGYTPGSSGYTPGGFGGNRR